jgi:hypothetical protein
VPDLQHGRRYLRVPLDVEAWVAWGYTRQRCVVSEFSTHGLTVKELPAPVGTPVSVLLPMPEGNFTLCGVVVHRDGPGGAAGVQLLDLPPLLQVDLELFLWGLLASSSSLPSDPRACRVAGCSRPHKARGYCSLHYNRWRRQQPRRPGEAEDGELPS